MESLLSALLLDQNNFGFFSLSISLLAHLHHPNVDLSASSVNWLPHLQSGLLRSGKLMVGDGWLVMGLDVNYPLFNFCYERNRHQISLIILFSNPHFTILVPVSTFDPIPLFRVLFEEESSESQKRCPWKIWTSQDHSVIYYHQKVTHIWNIAKKLEPILQNLGLWIFGASFRNPFNRGTNLNQCGAKKKNWARIKGRIIRIAWKLTKWRNRRNFT